MTAVGDALSGKTERDENFPVASRLVSPRRRPAILAFYRFVRAADDVADSPVLTPEEKLARLDRLEDALCGRANEPSAAPLRRALRDEGLAATHALDLLRAFRLDVTKRRYADVAELIDYCRLSAMPVGRFVLDVHGEAQSLWPASDALCAALQVINHLQDCADDYRNLDRVYLPLQILGAHGATVGMLAAPRSAPELRGAIVELAELTAALVDEGGTLIPQIADARLAAEIGAIHGLARRLARLLQRRDPLSERVRLSSAGFLCVGGAAALRALTRRFLRPWRVQRRTAP
jgi:squalene synthase HpnC